MKKINILKKSSDFDRIIQSVSPIKNRYFLIFIEKSDCEHYNFGFSVGKKIGNAVTRNKIRRRLKNIVDEKTYKNSFNCIIMVRKSILNLSFSEIESELIKAFQKLNIIEESIDEK